MSHHWLVYPGYSPFFKWLTETRVRVSFISLFSVKDNFSSIFKIVSIHLVVKQSSLTMGKWVIYRQANFLFAQEIARQVGWELRCIILGIIRGSVIFCGCQPLASSVVEGSSFGENIMIPKCWLTRSWSVLLLCSIYQALEGTDYGTLSKHLKSVDKSTETGFSYFH